MTSTFTRRNFISFSAAIFASILASTGHNPRFVSSNRFWNGLVKIYAQDFNAARTVGHAYLRETPQEYNAGILTELILQSGTDLRKRSDVLSEKDLIAKLRNLITEDFITENTVQVDGWVLSRTEARLCALCALL